jgi:hypothetical protein
MAYQPIENYGIIGDLHTVGFEIAFCSSFMWRNVKEGTVFA